VGTFTYVKVPILLKTIYYYDLSTIIICNNSLEKYGKYCLQNKYKCGKICTR